MIKSFQKFAFDSTLEEAAQDQNKDDSPDALVNQIVSAYYTISGNKDANTDSLLMLVSATNLLTLEDPNALNAARRLVQLALMKSKQKKVNNVK